MNRNPAGGAEVPQEGGYQEEHRATFGAGTIRPHEHIFVDVGAAFKGKPGLRCRHCYKTREEAEEKP